MASQRGTLTRGTSPAIDGTARDSPSSFCIRRIALSGVILVWALLRFRRAMLHGVARRITRATPYECYLREGAA